jgi:polo-like kinase 1
MEDKKKANQQQDFIVETPIVVEEKLEKGTGKVRKYERGKFLGKGGFAKCYEMKCVDTNKNYAAKVFEKKALTNARSRKKLINEIKLHKKLHHQNIVNFEHFFEDKDNVYILLELCSNQTLNELLKRRKRLTEIEVQCYLMQIIKALKYIHSHKIIHRDLKLGNCFITQKLELKLGDFGLAAKLEYEGQRRRTVCGTPNYIAPEILEKKNGHSFEVDVWSLGVVAYTLLFGKPPFETPDVKLTYKKIKMNNYSFPENIKVHPSAKKLISSILNLDPSKRPGLEAIADHEFFKIFNSVPVVLPLSTLACPPSMKYVGQYTKNEMNYNHLQNNNNFNNTFTSLQFKYNSNNLVKDNPLTNLELNTNINSAENLLKINLLSNGGNKGEILSKFNNEFNNAPLSSHRKADSCNNFEKENFIEKVNEILSKVNPNTRNTSNKATNEILSAENKLGSNEDLLKGLKLQSNLNLIDKLNEDEENNYIYQKGKSSKQNLLKRIIKFYDFTNKFGIIYFISNTHLGICFNDFSNIVKNVSIERDLKSIDHDNIKQVKNFTYLYFDKEGKNPLNFDENGFENFIQNPSINAKELIKKFEILKHISGKYTTEVLSMERNEFDTKFKSEDQNLRKIFIVKKFLKVQHALMFRLSNKLIQVSFVDKTELVMSTEDSEFYYKSKSGEELFDTYQNIMNSDNAELIKRIKYAKNLMIHFVKNQKSKKLPK